MKNFGFTTVMMMGMCMQTCCMRTISCAEVSDMFSITKVNSYAA